MSLLFLFFCFIEIFHFYPKSAILSKKKAPAAARRYNNKGFKQKKRLRQHGGRRYCPMQTARNRRTSRTNCCWS